MRRLLEVTPREVMATIEHNRQMWDRDWPDAGEGWSVAWGGVESQWFGTILNRIRAFVPSDTILEIGPGFGRWTQFLIRNCQSLIAVDLSTKCIEACRSRFRSSRKIKLYTNDGTSLAMIPDASVDFVFSFDSLVHADAEVIEAYLEQLSRKMKPDAAGFIHHSNLGDYLGSQAQRPRDVGNPHWRAENVSARFFEESCERAGLRCVNQEVVNWGGEVLNDCFSVFTTKASGWRSPSRVFVNPRFMDEARYFYEMSRVYSTESLKSGSPDIQAAELV